jgi:hypothetical protein
LGHWREPTQAHDSRLLPPAAPRICPTSADQSRKFADKGAAIANETLQKGKAAVDQSVQAFEQTYSAIIEQMRDYNLKMIDIAQANTAGVFEFARQLSTAKSSSDPLELGTAHAQKQTAMLNEQIKELTALGKKFAGESAEPFTRGVRRAFKKAS